MLSVLQIAIALLCLALNPTTGIPSNKDELSLKTLIVKAADLDYTFMAHGPPQGLTTGIIKRPEDHSLGINQ